MKQNPREGLLLLTSDRSMSVVYSVASLYHHGSLQSLIAFLAFVSTASWIVVLLTTFLRFVFKTGYKRRTKRLLEEESYDV
jgi:Flp pilus assembly protein TadB